jgi:hypothetical protein
MKVTEDGVPNRETKVSIQTRLALCAVLLATAGVLSLGSCVARFILEEITAMSQ